MTPPPAPTATASPAASEGGGETHSMRETATGLGRFWTLANGLSLARLALVVPITARIWQGADASDPMLLAMIVVGVMTDFFDGKVARWSKTVSEWGKVLDPLADKAAAVCLFAALTFRPGVPGETLPLWLFALVVVRDALILAGATVLARRRGVVPASIRSGKVAVFCIAVTVVVVLLRPDASLLRACVGVTAAMLFVSLAGYGAQFVRLWRAPSLPRASAKAPGAPASDL